MAIKDFFVQTAPGRRRYGVALLVGVIAGIMSAFVKWGGGSTSAAANIFRWA